MGFFNRLTDFGDREQVRTYAMRVSVGLNQIASTTSPQEIKGLSIAIKQEIQTMMMWASKLSNESINSLDVNVFGRKMLFADFLQILSSKSVEIVKKGGYSII